MDYDSPPVHENREKPEEKPAMNHYHADVIRPLFFIGAVLMLFAYPIFTRVISGAFILVLLGIILIILAGITNRRWKTLFFVNAMVSLLIVIVLEILARTLTFSDHPFMVVLIQLMAVIFVVALYYCLRTLRGFLFK